MNTLLWHMRRAAHRLGVAGIAGLALGLLALLLHVSATLPRQAQLAEGQARLNALRQQAAAPAPVIVETVDPLAALPLNGEAAQQIAELDRLAQAHGIALPRGQYSARPQAGTTLTRWQLVLPVEASYPALHAWLAAALERLPNLTLDEMKLKREHIESRTLQAELRLSLYVEGPP